jgi:MFS family permease
MTEPRVSGSLLGPMIGGSIGDNFGLENVFFITGVLLMISFITTALFVKESFTPPEKKTLGMGDVWYTVPEKNLTITLFVTFFVLSVALYSVEPIVTIYVTQLSNTASHIALMAGMVFSASGLANIIAAPKLGKLSDKIGAHTMS